ncbi:Serine protease, trypsin family protein [Photobacterium marinum]|uniref:Serine protease, trypsin family protein n=1 Tax=Photobacterium marinum TaxID=1056511 RepID=L8JBI9_9GAMM|nr:hypothetical protein [Photobacterium marinum]ELR64747.1 Serine protease, trypsin family protein [Photobacterium marinum]
MLKGYTIKFAAISALLALAGCESTYNNTYKLYQDYRLQTNNKAYAIGTNKIAGASWGARNTREAAELAIQTCEDLGGVNCSIVDINGSSLSR